MNKLAEKIKSGATARVELDGARVVKTVRQRSLADANQYVDDVVDYDMRLRGDTFTLPTMLDCYATEADGGKYSVVQVSEVVAGQDLAAQLSDREDRTKGLQHAIFDIATAEALHDGTLVVPADAKPANFIYDDEGVTYLVDTLPPLTSSNKADFPYKYISYGGSINNEWVDRYVRSRTGALARFVGMSLISEPDSLFKAALTKKSLDNRLEELFANIDSNSKKSETISDVRKKVRPFMGYTILRKGYNQVHPPR